MIVKYVACYVSKKPRVLILTLIPQLIFDSG